MLTIEEKAKAYDEAIEIAKEFLKSDPDNTLQIHAKGLVKSIFPQLREIDDEMMRNEIISYLKYCHTGEGDYVEYNDGWIDWLKSQCNDKSNEIANFKFKVGDWIIKDHPSGARNIAKVVNVIIDRYDSYPYNLEDLNGVHTWDKEYVENNYRLWTIQDSIPGDIIANDNIAIFTYDWVGIFKEYDKNNDCISVYCYVPHDDTNFYEEGCCISQYNLNPATKEQRERLFSKMADHGYSWNPSKLMLATKNKSE